MENLKRLCNKNKIKGRFYFKISIFWLLLIGIFIFQILPLINLIYISLKDETGLSFSKLIQIYSNKQYLVALKNTIFTSFIVMILTTLIATPVAFFVSRANIGCRKILRYIFYLGYMLPPFIGSLSWIILLNPNEGLINNLVKTIFNKVEPIFNIYSMGGLIFVMTIFYFPYAFITLVNGFEKMDTSLEEASLVSGGSNFKTFSKITLPIMMPTIISSAILVFVAAISSYAIPLIVGSNAKINTITTTIFELASYGDINELKKASLLSTMLMVIVFISLILSYLISRRSNRYKINNYKAKNFFNLGKFKLPITIFLFLVGIIIVLIPFLSIFVTSFIKDLSKPISSNNLTMQYWIKIFEHSSIVSSMKNSIFISIVAATISIILAIIIGYYSKKTDLFGKNIPEIMVMVSSSVPNMVIAISLIMAFTGKYGIDLYNTISILILAYISKYMFMALRNISQAYINISNDILEVAKGFGAGDIRIVKDIIFPIILPSILAGWFLVFMPSMYELAMSILLYSPSTSTIGVELYHFQVFYSHQIASALASVVIIFVFLLNLMASIARKKYR